MVHLAAVSRGEGVLRAAVTGRGRCDGAHGGRFRASPGLHRARFAIGGDEQALHIPAIAWRSESGDARLLISAHRGAPVVLRAARCQ